MVHTDVVVIVVWAHDKQNVQKNPTCH